MRVGRLAAVLAIVAGCGAGMPPGDGGTDAGGTDAADAAPAPLSPAETGLVGTWQAARVFATATDAFQQTIVFRADRTAVFTIAQFGVACTGDAQHGEHTWSFDGTTLHAPYRDGRLLDPMRTDTCGITHGDAVCPGQSMPDGEACVDEALTATVTGATLTLTQTGTAGTSFAVTYTRQ